MLQSQRGFEPVSSRSRVRRCLHHWATLKTSTHCRKLVNMALNVHRNHKAYWGRGEGGMEVVERKIIYLSLHCHHQNDSCFKMGSDQSHFTVSLIVRDKITRQCLQTKNLLKEKVEPKRNGATNYLLLSSLTPHR